MLGTGAVHFRAPPAQVAVSSKCFLPSFLPSFLPFFPLTLLPFINLGTPDLNVKIRERRTDFVSRCSSCRDRP